ncbi:MAG: ABC transporter permease [Caulobacteraceae bacterium]|nr:ABC transporter permease [Caulobacteraceae bacterium]
MKRPFETPVGRAARYAYWGLCAGIFAFLVAPVLAIIPLSFNSTAFLSYPLSGVSTRWYADILASGDWLAALRNSLIVAVATTLIATPLGVAAALGLTRLSGVLRASLLGVIAAPIVAPVVVVAIAVYFLYAPLGLTDSYLGLILAHTVLAVPFVVIAVGAALQGFDLSLMRAGASLGAAPHTVYLRVVLPIIGPGVFAGAVFAFMTSFDEIVVTMFLAGPERKTLPLRMFEGVRDQVSPTITAVATLLILTSVVLLSAVELLRRRGEKLNG